MYDGACKTGAGICVIIGGSVITGWWIIGAALLALLVVVGVVRYSYSKGLETGSDHHDRDHHRGHGRNHHDN